MLATPDQLADAEARYAALQAERKTKQAATRARRAAMTPYTDLPPYGLRRIAAATYGSLRGDGGRLAYHSPSKAACVRLLDEHGIRPTAKAVDAMQEAALELQAYRNRKAQLRWQVERNYKPCPPGRKLRCHELTAMGRLNELRVAAVRRAASQVFPSSAPAGCQWNIVLAAPGKLRDVGYRLATWDDRNVYAGAFKGWKATGITHTILVPREWRLLIERRGLAVVDGAFTLSVIPVDMAPAPGVEVVDAYVARRGRGYTAVNEFRRYARGEGGYWVQINREAANLDRALRKLAPVIH